MDFEMKYQIGFGFGKPKSVHLWLPTIGDQRSNRNSPMFFHRWPKSLFQTPIPLLLKKFWIRNRVLTFF